MLVDLQVYQEVFEIKFLHETEITYRAEALRMMRDPEFTVSQYLQRDGCSLAGLSLHCCHSQSSNVHVLCLYTH